jgi:hypothetical protein
MAKRIEDIDGKIRVWYVTSHGRFILQTHKIDSKSTDNPIGRSIEDIIEKDEFNTITTNLLKILGEFVYKWLTDDQYMRTGLDDSYDIVKTLHDELINFDGPCIQRPGLYITNWIPLECTECYYGDDYDINEVDEDFITISYHICIEDSMYLIEFY